MGAASKGFFGLSLSLSLSLSSFRNAVEEVVKSRARSLFLALLARSTAVSFPDTIFCQSDLKKVSTLSLMSLTFQIDHASPRQQSKNLWFSVLRFSPVSDLPPSNCSTARPARGRCPACRLPPCACHYFEHDIAVGGNKPLSRSIQKRQVRSVVRSAPVCQQISLSLCLSLSLSLSRCSCSFRTPERERDCRSRPRRGVN